MSARPRRGRARDEPLHAPVSPDGAGRRRRRGRPRIQASLVREAVGRGDEALDIWVQARTACASLTQRGGVLAPALFTATLAASTESGLLLLEVDRGSTQRRRGRSPVAASAQVAERSRYGFVEPTTTPSPPPGRFWSSHSQDPVYGCGAQSLAGAGRGDHQVSDEPDLFHPLGVDGLNLQCVMHGCSQFPPRPGSRGAQRAPMAAEQGRTPQKVHYSQ